MNRKVSMVVPCYNKVQYIGAMLESVLAQVWDNIEIILVNDGSTDGTRKVISGYQSKLKARGYTVIVVDQENKGVSMAVRAGLLRATGDYICMPDCDDVLLPEYVSELAGWMECHPDDKWVVCDCNKYRWDRVSSDNIRQSSSIRSYMRLPERFILIGMWGTVWVIMVRKEYLFDTGVANCLSLPGGRSTQEPQVWLPLILGQGNGTYIPKSLYVWNKIENSLSSPKDAEKAGAYVKEYNSLIKEVLRVFDIKDKTLYFLADIREAIEWWGRNPHIAEDMCERLSDLLMQKGFIKEKISVEIAGVIGVQPISRWLWSGFIDETAIRGHEASVPPQGRTIGYGALGKRAKRLLPLLEDTDWQPTELWDKTGDGLTMKKPDFDSLDASDTVLIFPIATEVIDEIKAELEGRNVRILCGRDIEDLIVSIKFPQFEHARLKEC